MKLTDSQKKEMNDLDQWFHSELNKLQKKQLNILQRYEEKVTLWKQAKLKKTLKNL